MRNSVESPDVNEAPKGPYNKTNDSLFATSTNKNISWQLRIEIWSGDWCVYGINTHRINLNRHKEDKKGI